MTEIDILPSCFNFLGFASSKPNGLTDKERAVLNVLKLHWDEDECIAEANEVLEPLNHWKSVYTNSPQVLELPLTSGWHKWDKGVLTLATPDDSWYVVDIETSQIGPGIWRPLCAVATNGKDYFAWLPNSSGQAFEEKIPYEHYHVSHNSSFDGNLLEGNLGSLCTMQIAAQLFGAADEQLNVIKSNKFVPWSNVSLPMYNSLSVLAGFCRVNMHSKDTRDLCKNETWASNYKNNLLEILNYCFQDTFVTLNIFIKLFQVFRKSSPNPIDIMGLIEISRFYVPMESNFQRWVVETNNDMGKIKKEWEDKIIAAVQTVKKKELEDIQFIERQFDIGVDFSNISSLYYILIKCGKLKGRLKKGSPASEVAALTKNTITIYKEIYEQVVKRTGKLTEAKHDFFDEKTLYPVWLSEFSPTPHNRQTIIILGGTYNKVPIKYEHPRYNIPTIEGDTAGIWWSSDVDLSGLECEYLDLITYGEVCRNLNPWSSLKDRLGAINFDHKEDRLWFTPSIHKSGTVTQRLTDNILHVAPKHNPLIPGTEIFGKILAPEGKLIFHADYAGQETMIFQAVCDKGELGSSGYGKIVLTGDMHTVIRDLLGIEKTKHGRYLAKKYTFLLQFGGGEEGCFRYQVIDGLDPVGARINAKSLIKNYVGEKAYYNNRKYFRGGLASTGYNELDRLSSTSTMQSLIFGRFAPLPLQAQYRGNNFQLTAKNWFIQGTGTDFLRGTFGVVRYLAKKAGIKLDPMMSVHDRLAWLGDTVKATDNINIIQAAHLICVSMLYRNTGFSVCPRAYALFDSIEVDNRFRINHLDPMVTPTNPNGFIIESCPIN